MSAATRPQTDETLAATSAASTAIPSSGASPASSGSQLPAAQAQAAADAEGWALLEGLRRRLDEQANQHRKTQTQVGQLAESIGALVNEQRRRSRYLNINSFVAYLVFTMLCGGAFYLLYQSRARELVADRDRIAHERDLSASHSKKVTDLQAARDAADATAWEAYQLLEAGKREEASKKLAALAGAPLSKFERTVLDGKAKQADILQVDATLKNVAAAFKAGRQADTIAPLEVALTLEPDGPRAALMHYYLGVAYAKTNVLEKAITHLRAAVEGDVSVEDARFHYASALDRIGEWGRAKAEYERFATAHPMSPHTTFATRRSWGLARLPEIDPKRASNAAAMQAGAASSATAATTTAPAPTTAPAASAPTAASAPPTAPKALPRPAPKKAAPVPAEPAPKVKTLDFSQSDDE